MSIPRDDDDWDDQGLFPEKHWDAWTDFDTPWDEQHRDGPPHPSRGGVFGRKADRFLIRVMGVPREEVKDMSDREKAFEIREFRSKLTPEQRRGRRAEFERRLEEMTPEEREAARRSLRQRGITAKEEDVPLSERMGFGDDNDEEQEGEVGQDYWRRFRRFAQRRGDSRLSRDEMKVRLDRDRRRFERGQENKKDSFNAREQRRKNAWSRANHGQTVMEGHFHAEGEGMITGSVFSSAGHTKLFKKVIGFTSDEVEHERNTASKWALEEYGLDFTKARESQDKLIIDDLAVMEPFVIHENIDVVQKSGKGSALLYAGGYKVTITASSVDLGGEHEGESAKCGNMLLYGHYYIDRGTGNPISACLFTSRRMASPDNKGNVTFRLDLKDHYATSKAGAKGEGKMIVHHEVKGLVNVSSTLEF